MNVAFIPVRGGSKSIPLKNIKEIAGKPLVYWVIKAAVECDKINQIYVSTDTTEIREVVDSFGFSKVHVISRSPETASDTATTESALMEFAYKYSFDYLALIQATSPLLTSHDLTGGFSILEQEGVDSVLSVVEQKRFLWNIDDNLNASSINYNIYSRPRRQDFSGYFVENGAFYLTSRQALISSKNRISGNIQIFKMNESSYFEIDEIDDWVIVEQLLKKRILKSEAKTPTHRIKLVATDCDGVLTDGGMYYTYKGEVMKKFNTCDGMGFEILKNHNIKTAIITGENNPLVKARSSKLKVDDVILGEKDKKAALLRLCKKYKLDITETVYIGDDIFDIPAIKSCGFGCAPFDAQKTVKEAARYVTAKAGGHGCFREVVDMICAAL